MRSGEPGSQLFRDVYIYDIILPGLRRWINQWNIENEKRTVGLAARKMFLALDLAKNI